VHFLDREEARLAKEPARFKTSDVGIEISDALELARDLAVRNASDLARSRYQRQLDELHQQLRNSQKVVIDVVSAQRAQLERPAGTVISERSGQEGRVTADDEHVLWPFDGEYWRDELGTYRQVSVDKCRK
jgi:hypothetical protein